MRYFKLSLYILLFIVVTFIIAVIYFQHNSDKLKNIITTELNKSVTCNVSFNNISTSIYKNFPNFSIVLDQVLLTYNQPVKSSTSIDTIASFSKIFIDINLLELLKNNYSVKSIKVKDGNFFIISFKDGTNSLDYISKNSTRKKDSLTVLLNEIVVSNIHVEYKNYTKRTNVSLTVNKLKLNGKISTNNSMLNAKGNLILHQLVHDKNKYFRSQKILFSTLVELNKKEIKILKSNIGISSINFISYGLFRVINEGYYIDLALKGNNINLKSLLEVLPDKVFMLPNKYAADGNFYINCFIKGNYNWFKNPDVKILFGIDDGLITAKGNNIITVSDLEFEGLFSNGVYNNFESSYLQFKKVFCYVNDNELTGEALLNNFTRPDISIISKSVIDMNLINTIISDKDFYGISGQVYPNLSISFPVESFDDFSITDYNGLLISGSLQIENASFDVFQNKVSNCNGEIYFDNGITIKGLGLKLNNNKYEISGKFNNRVSDFILDNSIYKFTGKLYSPNLYMNGTSNLGLINYENRADSITLLPRNINAQLKVRFDTLRFGEFTGNNFSCNMTYIPKVFNFDLVNLKTKTGYYKGKWLVSQNSFDNFFFKSTSNLEHIEIQNIFRSFNNFGQQSITHENISGLLTGDITISGELTNDISLINDKLRCKADFVIENGILQNYEPIYQLSRFTSIEELEKIHFAKLSNNIEIYNESIYFPQMEVISSAYNIRFDGVHQFDNKLEYNLEILLSELLSKKARQKNYNKNKDIFSGKGKMKLPIKIYGTLDNPEYKLDIKKAYSSFISGVKNEKEELKDAFHDGQINKIDNDTEENTDKFKIEWENDEVDNKESKEKVSNKNKNKNKKLPGNSNTQKFDIIWEEFDDTINN